MDKERVSKYINVFLESVEIEKEELDSLESIIEMPLSSLLLELISNVYEEYKDVMPTISTKLDDYDSYIIKPKNGSYSLEDFLINRLLRSVGIIACKTQYLQPESHYAHYEREILIDEDRMRNFLTNKENRRKVVMHEFLHALKAQFYNGYDFFLFDKYYQMKEKLKLQFPEEINDFKVANRTGQGYDCCKHVGLHYTSLFKKNNHDLEYYDEENLDEILNESDSIKMSNDKLGCLMGLSDGDQYMAIANPESTNWFITNYGFILRSLVDKKLSLQVNISVL